MKTPTTLILAGSALVLAAGSALVHTHPSDEEPTLEVAQAPAPQEQFMDYQCTQPEHVETISDLASNSWYAPSLGVGARFSPSDQLPIESVNDEGIIYSPSEAIDSTEGVSLLVGHVDIQPGVISEQGGELTAWGNLHRLEPCDLIYTAAADGTVVASQVVSMFVVSQFDPDLEAKSAAHPEDAVLAAQLHEQHEVQERIFRSSGDKRLVFLTCSGPSVQDVGGEFQFRYANNLIVETQPVANTEQNKTEHK